MFGFILRRTAVAIPTLLLLIVASFLLMHMAPGGPFTQERALPPQVLANLEAKYGLDDPLWRQIINYVWGIIRHFDFGPSFVYPDRTVNQIIAQGFPITLTYGFLSFILAVVVGVTLGAAAAIRQNTWLDYLAVGVSIGAQVLPNFVMAPILVLVFTLMLGWLPGGGWSFDNPAYWVMPVIALGTSYMASIARITRSSMLEVLSSNHIRTAKAKGLPPRKIILRHALDCTPGQALRFYVRPEEIRLLDTLDQSPNSFYAHVVKSEYLGAYSLVTLKPDENHGIELLAQFASNYLDGRRIVPGATLRIAIPADAIRLLPAAS